MAENFVRFFKYDSNLCLRSEIFDEFIIIWFNKYMPS